MRTLVNFMQFKMNYKLPNGGELKMYTLENDVKVVVGNDLKLKELLVKEESTLTIYFDA